jgi:hypothetical protein
MSRNIEEAGRVNQTHRIWELQVCLEQEFDRSGCDNSASPAVGVVPFEGSLEESSDFAPVEEKDFSLLGQWGIPI